MKNLPLFVFLVFLLSACRKDAVKNLTAEESRVYITEHDSTAAFGSYRTFRLADSVTVIDNGRFATREATAFDAALVQAFRQALEQRGYQLDTTHNTTPDLGINISRITSDYTGVVSYNDYWGSYGGYWDPYYWGYGGYDYYFPYSFGVYTYTEGAISVDMIDLKNPDSANNRLRTVWTGLARGTGIFGAGNINELVSALLAQSPYLNR